MDDKIIELTKYYDLVIATLNYYLETPELNFQHNGFDSKSHFEKLKETAHNDFKKGRLTKMKKWFRDLTEMQVETKDYNFYEYLKRKTGHDINLFQDYLKRIDKIISNGKITTDNQYREINSYVDSLCHSESADKKMIEILNNLLLDYEKRIK
jgi:hypothetical protein